MPCIYVEERKKTDMMKKTAALLMAGLVAAGLTGCGRRTGGGASTTVSGGSTPRPTASATARPSPTPSGSSAASGAENGEDGPASSGTVNTYENAGENNTMMAGLTAFRDTLSELYGDMYYPDTELTKDEIAEEIGLDSSLYEEIYAENTAGKAHPDTFIAVRVKDGKAGEVRKKLRDYKQKLLDDSDFAANADKVNAAEIVEAGDYMFFILAGDVEQTEDVTDLGAAFGEQIRRGAEAIRSAVRNS